MAKTGIYRTRVTPVLSERGRPGPISSDEIRRTFCRCLRAWADERTWLGTPLPRLLSHAAEEDLVEAALLVRALAKATLEETLRAAEPETASGRARQIYIEARLREIPLARAAAEAGKSRRWLVRVQQGTDPLLALLFAQKFVHARNPQARYQV